MKKQEIKKFIKMSREEKQKKKQIKWIKDFAFASGFAEGILFLLFATITIFFVIFVFIGILPFFKMEINLAIVLLVSVIISIILGFSYTTYLSKTAGKENQEIGDGVAELYNEEIEYYTKVIETNPKDVDAYNSRGLVYAKKGLYNEAINDYNTVIEIDPKNAEAYSNRGLAYAKERLYDYAIENCTEAIQINPKYAKAYNNRGIAYATKELYVAGTYIDDAIEDYTRAIQINPKLAEAYYNRGLAYDEKGLDKLCISDWKKATDLGSEEARQNLKEFFNIDY